MHYMLREILEQPEVLQNLLDRQFGNAREVAKLVERAGVQQVVLAARGTSDHAAVYGQYLFQTENEIPAFLATPSVVTLYDRRLPLRNTLVIGISQSGEASDVIEYMRVAREHWNPVVGITNNPQGPFKDCSDVLISLETGPEKSVAATKTYTASLMALAMISSCLPESRNPEEGLQDAPELVSRALAATDCLKAAAEETSEVDEAFVIGRGLNYTVALETALKIMETSYARARAYSSADLMHGPVAAVRDVPCIVYSPHDAAQGAVMEVAERLRDIGSRLMVISSDKEALDLATDPVPMPVCKWRHLDPIGKIIAGQKFAYHLSVAKGLDPDRPRGLSKVTVTR